MAVTVTDELLHHVTDDEQILYHNGRVLLHVKRDGTIVEDNRTSYRENGENRNPPSPSRWKRLRAWIVNMVTLK